MTKEEKPHIKICRKCRLALGLRLFLVALLGHRPAHCEAAVVPHYINEVHTEEFASKVTQMRQHLHTIPEIMYKEYKTSLYVEEKLREVGVTNISHLVETGIVADLGTEGPIFAIRAELDALPMEEPPGLSFR